MKKTALNSLIVLMVFLVVSSLSATVFAGNKENASHESSEKKDHYNEIFSYKDKNQDGAISKQEWPGSDESFLKIDADGDVTLSLDEFKERLNTYSSHG